VKFPPPPAGHLGEKCADLVALGDPADVYAAYESALGTGLLASTLQKVQSSLRIPEGTLVTANKPADENNQEVLTLTGWSALGAVFALVTLTLLVAVKGYQRWRGARYVGYEMVVKSPQGGNIELQ